MGSLCHNFFLFFLDPSPSSHVWATKVQGELVQRSRKKKGGEGEGNENTFGLLFRSAICASATINCAQFLFPFPLQYYSYSFSRESLSCNHARPGYCENARRSMPPDSGSNQSRGGWGGLPPPPPPDFPVGTLWASGVRSRGERQKTRWKEGGRGGVRTRKTCFAFPFFFFLPLPSPNNPNLPPKKKRK